MSEALYNQRLDKWLWHARFAKTRSLAQKLVTAGKVRIDREKVTSASKTVRIGNTLTLSLPRGVKIVEISAIAERRGPYSEASLLYKDLTPPQEIREPASEAVKPVSHQKEPRPDKHRRRKAIRLKQIYPDD